MTIVRLLTYAIPITCYLSWFAGLFVTARASMTLRARVGPDASTYSLLLDGGRVTLGMASCRLKNPAHSRHLQEFGRHMRVALALALVPLLPIGALHLYALYLLWWCAWSKLPRTNGPHAYVGSWPSG
jgi:hypothetical protein